MKMRVILFGFWLFFSFLVCGKTYAQPYNPDQPIATSGKFIKVAEFSIGEILHLDADRLVALGAGIIVGTTVVAPYFGLRELTGIVVGVLMGSFAHQTWSSYHSNWYSF